MVDSDNALGPNFADMADVECLCIDKDTNVRQFRNELRWNAAAYR